MQKELISVRQAICIIIMFMFGSSVVMGVSSETAQDSWLSVLLAGVFAVPLFLVYARIMKLLPEKDLFEIIEILFGKITGKIFILLMTWYALHLCALVLRNFSEFIEIYIMPETPQLPIMISMILVVVYMTKSGIEAMGKWSVVILPIIFFVVILTILLSIQKMDFTNIMPIMEHSFGAIAAGSYQIVTFPYAETVLFLSIACAIQKNDSPYKVYMASILITTIILLFVVLRNIFLLGPTSIASNYFPSYMAVRLIEIGDFLSRIEGSIAMNFILAGIIKLAVCLIAAAKGTARLFNMQDERHLLVPISLLIVAFSAIVYKNVMEMFDFLAIYQFYVIPFQMMIPLIIWITAEVKMHKGRLAKLNHAAS